MAAGGVALSVAQVGGKVVGGAVPPTRLLGDFLIRVTPVSVTEALIRQVGHSDKLVLLVCILMVATLAAATVGVRFSRGHLRQALVGIGLLAALPALAATGEPAVTLTGELLVLLPAGLLGAAVLWALGTPLLTAPHDAATRPETFNEGSASTLAAPPEVTPPISPWALPAHRQDAFKQPAGGINRRQVLRATLVLAASAAVGTSLVWRLSRPSMALMSRLKAALPRPRRPLAPLTDEFAGVGASPLVTPVGQFYRVDTALSPPLVDPDSWTLTLSRDGKRLAVLSYDELLAMATSQSDITIGCVSNEVGGDLIGTARWQGVLLSDLLGQADVTRAGRIAGVSVDGFVASFPGGYAFDRPSMVAVGMNNEVLPVLHGFPARLVVPGLYGYTSATKWLQTLDVSDSTDLRGFWADRGWTPAVTIHITSRIDSPRNHAALNPGPVPIAGIAWAPVAGVGSVAVQVDDGPWQNARLSTFVTGTLWRQWVFDWQASPGRHRLQVRATDTRGHAQDTRRRPVFPSGATGLHQINVTVP